ncbi:hypothetical protein P168DRAFT_71483 [Aspergillus campestris IBT 28561]|uniref:Uncharacterized protein n=1 Tax=Aspergillus campestris (strain IBT 28561) TaxID=1392248 RepID=A0A2I1CRH0_ASPC2|nr:uncharacterized protein P168DRAFT_71483 [Aspergillus campestris IBT 28561]PKY00207.1 hypothetical protein P168DRAFT_71483 [Aspergillus campestris IBT 28561]
MMYRRYLSWTDPIWRLIHGLSLPRKRRSSKWWRSTPRSAGAIAVPYAMPPRPSSEVGCASWIVTGVPCGETNFPSSAP